MEIVIENPTVDNSTNSLLPKIIDNNTLITSTSPVTPLFPILPSSSSSSTQNRPYRTAYVTNDGKLTQNIDYYRTLQSQTSRNRDPSPEPIYETNLPIQTSQRRVDRSGLLEIAETEPAQSQQRTNSRNRNSTSPEITLHGGTLTRRIDRSGLLEAVPELPDNCQNWKNPDSSENHVSAVASSSSSLSIRDTLNIDRNTEIIDAERKNTNIRRVQTTSPRNSRSLEISSSSQDRNATFSENSTIATSPCNNTTTTNNSATSSPYLRRYPNDGSSSSLERPTPIFSSDETRSSRNRNSFTCLSPNTNKFLPIDALASRSRQSYVDLTGSTYTRSPTLTSPIGCATRSTTTATMSGIEGTRMNFGEMECSKRQVQQQGQQPDCLGRLSPRTRNDSVKSPLTMSSSIPDVIEAHGSRTRDKSSPVCERAEAEGCEQQRVNVDDDKHDDTRLTFKGTKKILHNDNIQTLRVIILSEQL